MTESERCIEVIPSVLIYISWMFDKFQVSTIRKLEQNRKCSFETGE